MSTMTALKKTIETLSNTKSRLFGSVYSPIKIDEYDEEKDELETAITGLVDNTQQTFSLSISLLHGNNRFDTEIYGIEVRYFQIMKAEIAISGQLLFDFLLDAQIVVHPDQHQMAFVYNPD